MVFLKFIFFVEKKNQRMSERSRGNLAKIIGLKIRENDEM